MVLKRTDKDDGKLKQKPLMVMMYQLPKEISTYQTNKFKQEFEYDFSEYYQSLSDREKVFRLGTITFFVMFKIL